MQFNFYLPVQGAGAGSAVTTRSVVVVVIFGGSGRQGAEVVVGLYTGATEGVCVGPPPLTESPEEEQPAFAGQSQILVTYGIMFLVRADFISLYEITSLK